MGQPSGKLSAGLRSGAVVVLAGLVLQLSSARASMGTDGVGLFTPGVGCGPSETQVGAGDLLARVRADGSAAARRGDMAQMRPADRQRTQGAARTSRASRFAQKAPAGTEEEPRASVLRSFYTCNAAPLPNLTEGTGWRLVGPLRQS